MQETMGDVKEVTTRDEPKYRGVKAMPFVIGNETFEKLGTIGTSSNLLVYLTSVFNMKTITATNIVNVFNGTCNFGTLLGAFLSDTYFGRYKTLGFASISSFALLNQGALTLSSTIRLSEIPCNSSDHHDFLPVVENAAPHLHLLRSSIFYRHLEAAQRGVSWPRAEFIGNYSGVNIRPPPSVFAHDARRIKAKLSRTTDEFERSGCSQRAQIHQQSDGRRRDLEEGGVAGMLILTLTAAISNLHPPSCGSADANACAAPTGWQMTFLLSAFALLVVGASGIRPCNLAFGADQFNPNTESGKRGTTSFFNWYYFTYTFAMMVSLTVIVYVQSNKGWALGLAIPTFLMFLSCAFFFVGTRMYVMVIPTGSPLTSVVRVLVAAIKKRKVELPEQPSVSLYNHFPTISINSKLVYTDQFRFLNKAAIVTSKDQIKSDGSARNPWRLCSIQQVEEVKCLLRIIPIWAAGIIYYVSIVQQQTYVVFQALQSDRHLGNTGFQIPAASYIFFTMLCLTIWIPIYDRTIVPILRKLTKREDGITTLQKIGIGMGIAIATMIVSAVVERYRRDLALTKPTLGIEPRKGAISSMSGLWLVAQLSLAGLSEAFTIIGQVEFFYKQFPENMRSIGGSFLSLGLALSSYLSSFLVSTVHRVTEGDGRGNWLAEDLNKGRLDYFYYLIAALEVLNLAYFLVCANWYKYKGDSANTFGAPLEELQSEKHPV
ncbi:hypothetical protein RHSIM_Rhsim08G0160800 [Rhododendron simsii]|uniref:Uncharacterized protein n=1 Tax=Rhododendron simsii TaxID=118357 RepID=A0A834GLP6_RHOSS|nr:hypothetical protein RHSIM_Rhsim08G0160800 [Rhododendron simsii]